MPAATNNSIVDSDMRMGATWWNCSGIVAGRLRKPAKTADPGKTDEVKHARANERVLSRYILCKLFEQLLFSAGSYCRELPLTD
jgi:hypothetical protein